jgi:hypothetical protein
LAAGQGFFGQAHSLDDEKGFLVTGGLLVEQSAHLLNFGVVGRSDLGHIP